MSEFATLSCPSCGSAYIKTDIFCRKCGFLFQSGNENLIRRGRNIVILVAIITLFLEILVYLVDPSINYLSYVIRILIEIVIFYLIYRGYSFARWLLGIRYIGGCIVGILILTKLNSINIFTLGFIALNILMASLAGLLLIPRSVRIFQNTQRKSNNKVNIPDH
jgi:hypothetical protein